MPFLIALRNLRLSLGILIALVISLLGTLSWARRMPTLAVLLRRRLRRAVVNPPSTDAVSAASLWRQSTVIPGNRGDGFRFQYLLLMIVLTPLYLWLELSFGVNLLDTIGSDVTTEDTDAIEHWGRLISGLAVALVFLKTWWAQCEKWNRAWPVRIVVSVAIAAISIVMTWKIQNAVIEFHIQRTNAAITVSLTTLLILILLIVYAIRTWLSRATTVWRLGLPATLGGLLGLVAISLALLNNIGPVIGQVSHWLGEPEALVEDLGKERQQAARLALIRRAMQQQWYAVGDSPVAVADANSAEGKTALALLPIIGNGLDQTTLARDLPDVLAELMYRDWKEQAGDAAWQGFAGAVDELRQQHAGPYAQASAEHAVQVRQSGRAAADAQWAKRRGDLFGDKELLPGLGFEDFSRSAYAARHLRMATGCFDCAFTATMDRDAFSHEYFKYVQANNVRQMRERFESAEHFAKGRDGENAARAYWVPIWALLFSMVGAFTHIFKISFTVTEYAIRRTLQRAGAADSMVAAELVRNAKGLLGAALVLIALFIYFFDNRVTGHENYPRLYRQMWVERPMVGALASHWTINAQGLIYPFTRKIRPDWLVFASDPTAWLLGRDEDEFADEEMH